MPLASESYGKMTRPPVGRVPGQPATSTAPLPRARRRRDGLRIALFVLIFLDVSRLHQAWSILAAIHVMQVLVACVLFYSVANPKLLVDLRAWSGRWPARVVAALAALACLSAAFGLSFGASASYILYEYSRTLILAFLLMATIRNAHDLVFYAWAYVAACAVLVYQAMFVFHLSNAGSAAFRLSNLYMYDANDVTVVILAGLGLCFFTFQTSGRLGKVASAVIMAGMGVVLARSGSRGGFLGLVAFALAFLLIPAKTSLVKRVATLGVVAIALLLGSPEGYWRQMQTILSPEQDYNWSSPTGRRMLTKRGIGYMESYPLFGVGVSNFGRAEEELSERAKDWRPGMRHLYIAAPHNSYVQVGAEMGLPALLLWGSLVVGGAVSCWRLRRRRRGPPADGDPEQRLLNRFAETLPLSLVGFGVSAAFVSFAYLDPIYILAAFLTGIHVAARAKRDRDTAPVVPGPHTNSMSRPSSLRVPLVPATALRSGQPR